MNLLNYRVKRGIKILVNGKRVILRWKPGQMNKEY